MRVADMAIRTGRPFDSSQQRTKLYKMYALLAVFGFLVIAMLATATGLYVQRRRYEGKFVVVLDDEHSFLFVTSLGVYSINDADRTLHYAARRGHGVIAWENIEEVVYVRRIDRAWLDDVVNGCGVFDFLPTYRDTVEYYGIEIVTRDQQCIPVYLSAAYRPREYATAWLIELLGAALEISGLLVNVQRQARYAHERLCERLGLPHLPHVL